MSLLRRDTTAGLLTLVVATALVVVRPSVADAAGPSPTVAVGANVNLSKVVGNQFEGSVAIDPTNPLRMFVLARDETGNLLGGQAPAGVGEHLGHLRLLQQPLRHLPRSDSLHPHQLRPVH